MASKGLHSLRESTTQTLSCQRRFCIDARGVYRKQGHALAGKGVGPVKKGKPEILNHLPSGGTEMDVLYPSTHVDPQKVEDRLVKDGFIKKKKRKKRQ